MRTYSGLFAGVLALLLAFGVPAPAHAQSADQIAAAVAAFQEGSKLMADGNCAEAIPRFEASHRIDPSFGALFNLASCLEQVGRTATAWARFNDAGSMAMKANNTERMEKVRRRIDALEAKLVRLSIVVRVPAQGLEVKRNGALVDRGLWGMAVPVDPGQATIEASAPGKSLWQTTVQATEPGKTVTVEIPAPLGDVAPPPAVAAPPAVAPPPAMAPKAATVSPLATAPGPVADTREPTFFQRHRWSVITGAAAVALAGVGTGFAVKTMTHYSDLATQCGSTEGGCTQADRDSVHGDATVTNVLFASAGVAAVTSAVLFLFVERPKKARSVSVAPSAAGGTVVVRY